MFAKTKAYIKSFRLRTLPLSLSGIILGIMLAAKEGNINFFTVIFLISTTLCLQILSNLANEYGDFVKGSDNNQRLGPIFSIQSGILSKRDILNSIIIFSILSAINGLILIATSINNILSPIGISFIILGGFAIISALLYTLGKHAYGYKGLGDIFVFIFFGLVSTLGSYTLIGGIDLSRVIFPAISIGLLSTAVLNLNNIRDVENDSANNKNTIVVRLGVKRAKIYHYCITICAILSQSINHLFVSSHSNLLWTIIIPILLYHIYYVHSHNGKSLDKHMPLLTFTTLLLSLLTGI